MLKLNFYFLQLVPKIHTFGESDKDESSGEKQKLTNYVICFMLFCIFVKLFYENCPNWSLFAILAYFDATHFSTSRSAW